MLLNHRTQNTTHGIYTLLKTPRILSQILKNPNTTCLPHMPYFIYIYIYIWRVGTDEKTWLLKRKCGVVLEEVKRQNSNGKVQKGVCVLWKQFREQKDIQWCSSWSWKRNGIIIIIVFFIFFDYHPYKSSTMVFWDWELQVERRMDLIYGGGSVGLMGLVSQKVYDGGCHVLG